MGVSGAKEVKFTTFAGRKNLIELKLVDGVPANISVGMPFFVFMYYTSKNIDCPDLHNAYESYKLGMTDRETYLEQRKPYEQLLVRMQENNEKQKATVSKMATVDLPEIPGLKCRKGR